MKDLGTNWTKNMKDLSTESYRTLVGKIRVDLNKWRDTPGLVGRLNKMLAVRAGAMAQVVGCMPSKCKALSSNPSTKNNKKRC
jgi:hypothetical protein